VESGLASAEMPSKAVKPATALEAATAVMSTKAGMSTICRNASKKGRHQQYCIPATDGEKINSKNSNNSKNPGAPIATKSRQQMGTQQ
jgi:hypothetical protein